MNTDKNKTEKESTFRDLDQSGGYLVPKAILDALPSMIWIKDADGVFKFVNKVFADACGKDYQEIVGKNDFDVWTRALAANYVADDLEVLQSGLKKSVEEEIAGPDSVSWFETFKAPIRDSEGRVKGTIGTATDITRRKSLELALQNQKRFLKLMMDAIPDYIFFKDINSRYIGCNKAFAEGFIGLDEAEIIGKTDLDFVPDKALAAFFVMKDQEMFASGEAQINEETIQLKNGTVIDIETIKTPFLDENGKIAGLIGVSRDITARKTVQEQLKESEKRLSLTTQGGKIGLWDWQVQTGKTVFNESWANIIGYTLSELEPVTISTWEKLVHPEDLQRCNQVLERCFLRDLDYYEIEARMKHRNDSWVWILDRGEVVEWDAAGKPLRMVGTHIDINDRKLAEEALEKNERILSAVALSIKELIDNKELDDAIANCFEILGKATGVDQIYLFMNDYDHEDKGFCSQRMVWKYGEGVQQRSHKNLQKIPFEEVSDFVGPMLRGETYHGIVRKMKDAKVRGIMEERNILSAVILPIFVKGRFWGFVGFYECKEERVWTSAEFDTLNAFSHSIEKAVERSLIVKELEQSRQYAESANALKSQFIANLSHEIRTPMNAIVGYTTLLKDLVDGEKGQNYLNAIQKAGNTLVNFINDILDLSKIEVGKLELRAEQFPIRQLVDEIHSTFTWNVKEKGLSLIVDVDPEIPSVLLMDGMRFRQVLFNLIGNAVKFTDKGMVEVSVHWKRQKAAVEIIDLEIVIKDTGIGIPEDQHQTIFEPFKQMDGQSNKKYGGTGLGLSISKRLVEVMGGSISLESRLGEGSLFTVTLPGIQVFMNESDGAWRSTEQQSESLDGHTPEFSPETRSTENQTGLTEGVTPLLIEQLDRLKADLWETCSRGNRISDVRELAARLYEMGECFSCGPLLDYASNLGASAKGYHAGRIRELLSEFPSILENLRKAVVSEWQGDGRGRHHDEHR